MKQAELKKRFRRHFRYYLPKDQRTSFSRTLMENMTSALTKETPAETVLSFGKKCQETHFPALDTGKPNYLPTVAATMFIENYTLFLEENDVLQKMEWGKELEYIHACGESIRLAGTNPLQSGQQVC